VATAAILPLQSRTAGLPGSRFFQDVCGSGRRGLYESSFGFVLRSQLDVSSKNFVQDVRRAPQWPVRLRGCFILFPSYPIFFCFGTNILMNTSEEGGNVLALRTCGWISDDQFAAASTHRRNQGFINLIKRRSSDHHPTTSEILCAAVCQHNFDLSGCPP
jgi:hypothetical protein